MTRGLLCGATLQDFGLSQRLDAQATHVSNFGAGTPFYVAPEVATMKRTSLAADVFSFGVIAWCAAAHLSKAPMHACV